MYLLMAMLYSATARGYSTYFYQAPELLLNEMVASEKLNISAFPPMENASKELVESHVEFYVTAVLGFPLAHNSSEKLFVKRPASIP
jgi:hypothetical protein